MRGTSSSPLQSLPPPLPESLAPLPEQDKKEELPEDYIERLMRLQWWWNLLGKGLLARIILQWYIVDAFVTPQVITSTVVSLMSQRRLLSCSSHLHFLATVSVELGSFSTTHKNRFAKYRSSLSSSCGLRSGRPSATWRTSGS